MFSCYYIIGIIIHILGEIMNLFDYINDNMFSVLASPNRRIYAEALNVLYEAFNDEKLQIPEETYYSMLRSRMEDILVSEQFKFEEDMLEEEYANISGRARFIIRKLYSKGWFEKERDENFKENITLPLYSIKLLELFNVLSHNSQDSGYSYVYSTYTTLKDAQEEDDIRNKTEAVYFAYNNTNSLIKMLKTVYHNIKRYFLLQMETADLNKILANHYDDFSKEIVEKYIRPLKIKDSVPKYRVFITSILDEWLEDRELLEMMAKAAKIDKRGETTEECKNDLINKIFYIKESYEHIQKDYLDEIDKQVRKCTRQTTQKIEIITNHDQTVRGNINYLLSHIASSKNDYLLERIQPIFEINRQKYISEKSLWHRKRIQKRTNTAPVIIDEDDKAPIVLSDYENIFKSKYSKANVNKYMQSLFDCNDTVSTVDMEIKNDDDFIMSALITVNSNDSNSFYYFKYDNESINKSNYTIPNIKFKKRI